MNTIKIITLLLLIFINTSCKFNLDVWYPYKINPENIIDEEYNKMCQDFFKLLNQKKIEEAKTNINFELLTNFPKYDLEKYLSYFENNDKLDVKIVEYQEYPMNNNKMVNIAYQTNYLNKYIISLFEIAKINNIPYIVGLRFRESNVSMIRLNSINLSEKSERNKISRHYTLLFLGSAILVFILVVFIICLFTKISKKILWLFFIFVGLGNITLNWTNGEFFQNLFTINIPTISFWQYSPYHPCILKISFPIGAVLFLIKRNKIKENELLCKEEKKYDG